MIVNIDNNKPLFEGYLYLNEAKTITNERKNQLNLGTLVKVEVRDLEGMYEPHFHVSNRERGSKRIDTCVKIYDNRFFSHGTHTFEFSSSYNEILDNWLNKPYYKLINGLILTNWEVISKSWTDAFGKHPSYTTIKPDYTIIKPTK